MKNRKKYNGLIRMIKIVAAAGLLTLFFVIGLIWFARPKTSAVEKRTLTEFPKLTWSSFWDGSFFSGVDTWYADTYPLREALISGDQALESHYGLRGDQIVNNNDRAADDIPDASTITPAVADPDAASSAASSSAEAAASSQAEPEPEPEENLPDGTIDELGEKAGSIYITKNAGYGIYYFYQEGADTFASTVNQVYQNVGDLVDLYVMIIPISGGVMLDERVQEDMQASDQAKAIEYLYARMDPGVHTVSIFDNLKKHNAEYIYFHTDHHWTALGAYYAYQMFCQEKGIEPHTLDEFEQVEYDNFLGSFYSSSNQSPALAANPDTVVGYVPNGTNLMTMRERSGNELNWRIVNDVSNYRSGEKYSCFAGGDNPWSYAHNETITDGSAVVVIKDSFGNAFIPWLVDHYEHIYWIDIRYTTNTIRQMVQENGIQDVVIALNIDNGTSKALTDELLRIGS